MISVRVCETATFNQTIKLDKMVGLRGRSFWYLVQNSHPSEVTDYDWWNDNTTKHFPYV